MAASTLSRLGRVCAITITASGVVLGLGSCASTRESHAIDYCAIMPDSVGLYAGNPVTQMGYEIGTVKKVTPSNLDVRVDFTVTANRRLPMDVRAVLRSESVLADRSLELVGNSKGGPQLATGGCIPLTQSFTPKSLSEMIGSATDLMNSISPEGSHSIGDVVHGLDEAMQNKGSDINQLLTRSSALLNSPDQTISALGSTVVNVAQLTTSTRELSGLMKQVMLDMQSTLPSVVQAQRGGASVFGPTLVLVKMVADIEENLGDALQYNLNQTSVLMRKASAHAPAIADLLNPVPSWINIVANHINNRQISTLRYRPPLYRIRTPNGVALCNIMNAQTPGTCANVQGTPYAVDVALLQYVLTQASR